MRAVLDVARCDPQAGAFTAAAAAQVGPDASGPGVTGDDRRPGQSGRRLQRYEIELPEGSTVLEALMAVQDELDGTLAFRRACRHAICGSCGMRINGCARLACNTQVSVAMAQAVEMAGSPGHARPVAAEATAAGTAAADAAADDAALAEAAADGATARDGEPGILIEPLGNMTVVKDLVTDMDGFWTKLCERRPWLFAPAAPPGPDDEFRVSPAQADVLAQGVLCLECGICYSDCNAVEAEPQFVGPAALVKAHRYSFDPRDENVHERAVDLAGEHGLWECMRCYFCTQRCPKHIRVRELIAQLGELGVREGLDADPGARHAQAFVDSLRRSGRLNETDLALKSQGWSWTMRRLPLAVRVALAGKLSLPPGPIDAHDALLAVMARAEQDEQDEQDQRDGGQS
jgi:succinate dehydrogenase / fumarate reductase, iron-sulfur subunit